MNSKSLYERIVSIDPLKLGCYLTAMAVAYISFELTKALLDKIFGESISEDTILYLAIVLEWAKFYIPFLYFRLKSKGAKLKADMFAILGLLLSVVSFSASYLTIDSQIIRLQTEQSSSQALKDKVLKQTELLQQVSVRQVGYNQTTKASDNLKDASKLLEVAASLESNSSNSETGENAALYKWKTLINIVSSLSIEFMGLLMAMFICHNGAPYSKEREEGDFAVGLAERVTKTVLTEQPDAVMKEFAVVKSEISNGQTKEVASIPNADLGLSKSASAAKTVEPSLSECDRSSVSNVTSTVCENTSVSSEVFESVSTFNVDIEKIRTQIANEQLTPSVRGLKDCLVDGKYVTPDLTKVICEPLVDSGVLRHYRRGYQLVKQS